MHLMMNLFCYVGLHKFYAPIKSRITDGRIGTALLIKSWEHKVPRYRGITMFPHVLKFNNNLHF